MRADPRIHDNRSKAAPTLLGRVVWIVVLLFVGIAAAGLQMDRQARQDVAFAHEVPRIARAYALLPLANEAYQKKDFQQGLAYARLLVQKRPVPAEQLALLATGLIQTGQTQQGYDILLMSARRGWREGYTQIVMARMALEGAEPSIAAARILALWRTNIFGAEARQLTVELLEVPGGLKALADGMLARDPWGTSLLVTAMGGNVPTDQIARLSRAMAAKHMVVMCPQLAMPLRKLARQGQAANAERIWSPPCADGFSRSGSDYTFNPADQQGPLDWDYPRQAGLALDVVKADKGLRLEYEYREFDRVALAKRTANLSPGTHAIHISGHFEDLEIGIACFTLDQGVKSIFRSEAKGATLPFTIPARCPGQNIEISTRHGEGRIERFDIE